MVVAQWLAWSRASPQLVKESASAIVRNRRARAGGQAHRFA